MIIYKIKKIFREGGGQEIIKMSLGITIILAGFIPALPLNQILFLFFLKIIVRKREYI